MRFASIFVDSSVQGDKGKAGLSTKIGVAQTFYSVHVPK